MLKEVLLSGVAFSRDPNGGGPYRVINYDETRGSTTSVTSGTADGLKTFYCHLSFDGDLPAPVRRVIALITELESLLESEELDIEFALDREETLYLLQVRRLSVPSEEDVSPEKHRRTLLNIERRVRELSRTHPHLHGSRTVFGIMPDWNPAEIIGIRPRPLALSLYKELVTDNIWAYQRDNYGYKNLRSFPLLVSFAGQPYIDARVDFNSFIPASVNHDLSERLADHYIDRLIRSPHHHDKVEFEILYTCYTFDLPERLKSLSAHGFSDEDLVRLSDGLR
ncbi:MAG: phosphoenolpyruvate synthase, partial [Deltaproteobacteria bacterium]|nr:phosphoenolpyruvate synthase [Deltaproteobacteria bacterium]